jgi:hypothetical protein
LHRAEQPGSTLAEPNIVGKAFFEGGGGFGVGSGQTFSQVRRVLPNGPRFDVIADMITDDNGEAYANEGHQNVVPKPL